MEEYLGIEQHEEGFEKGDMVTIFGMNGEVEAIGEVNDIVTKEEQLHGTKARVPFAFHNCNVPVVVVKDMHDGKNTHYVAARPRLIRKLPSIKNSR